jgi:hypothetical protein
MPRFRLVPQGLITMGTTYLNIIRWLNQDQEGGELRGRLIVITVTSLRQLTDTKTLGYVIIDEREEMEAASDTSQEDIATLHNQTQRCIKLVLRRGQTDQFGP